MPVLRIRLIVRILHQCVILEDAFPVFVVFAISRILAHELFDRYLVTVEVLENQIVEMRHLVLFAELDLDVGLARPL